MRCLAPLSKHSLIACHELKPLITKTRGDAGKTPLGSNSSALNSASEGSAAKSSKKRLKPAEEEEAWKLVDIQFAKKYFEAVPWWALIKKDET